MLPVILLTGALVQIASAQTNGAQTAAPSALSSLVSTLSVFAFLALLVGLFRPKTFAFLFKEKATRGRVCGAFGAAWLFLVILDGPLKPKRVATTPTTTATVAQPQSQNAVRLAENRAKAAEARAARAEKAAAVSNAKASAKAKTQSARRVAKSAVAVEAPASDAAPAKETLPDNITVQDIPGVGKRQVGVVDDVEFAVLSAEKAASIGGTQADGMFYVLHLVAMNNDKETHDVTTLLMKLVDDQGREFDPSSEAALALAMAGDKNAQAFSAQVQPGVIKKVTLVYDAPADASGLHLKIPAGGFGFGKSASIKVPTAGE